MRHRLLPDRRPRPVGLHAAGAVAGTGLALLALAGCSLVGGGDDDSSATPSPSPSATSSSSASSSASSSSSPSPSGSSSPDGSASASPEGDPFKTIDGFVDDDKVTLEVYPLRRDGDLIVLQLKLNVDSAAEGSAQVAATFDDGANDTGAKDLDSMDGLEVVDGENSKVYLVATDTEHTCLCSEGLGSAIIQPGQSVTLDASFAAPPEDVSSVDVRIPDFGTTADVPIQ